MVFGVQGSWRFSSVLGFSIGVWRSPPLDLLPDRSLTAQLNEDLAVARDNTRISAAADLGVQVVLMSGTLDAAGSAPVEVILGVGGGVVRTVDELESMGAEDVPRALATQVQLHPTLNLRTSARVQIRPRLVLGLEVHRFSFQEVYWTDYAERTSRSAITLVVETSLGRPR